MSQKIMNLHQYIIPFILWVTDNNHSGLGNWVHVIDSMCLFRKKLILFKLIHTAVSLPACLWIFMI